VATAPGEKLLIGRRPVRNWTQLQFFSLFYCELLRLFVQKSTKTAATTAALFGSQYAPNRLSAGTSPQTPLEELTALPRPPGYLGGLFLKEERAGGSSSFAL